MFAAKVSIAIMLVAYLLHRRMSCNQKPSVTDQRAYHRLAFASMAQATDPHMYENPSNYKRSGGKLKATSPQLVRMEKTINAKFRDKLAWCLPPTYGDLEMNGPFPTAKTCGLEALCKTMTDNVNVFRTEFNANKAHFADNPEKLGYGSRYGRIHVNRVQDEFPRTCRILEASVDYARTQTFIKYTGGEIFATMFTVLYPGASIRPHFGPTNFRYRIHLCLDIDGIGGIVTAHGTRLWKVGQIFILDDSYLHAGFYDGTRPRVILMVDITKPCLTLQHIDSIHTREISNS